MNTDTTATKVLNLSDEEVRDLSRKLYKRIVINAALMTVGTVATIVVLNKVMSKVEETADSAE